MFWLFCKNRIFLLLLLLSIYDVPTVILNGGFDICSTIFIVNIIYNYIIYRFIISCLIFWRLYVFLCLYSYRINVCAYICICIVLIFVSMLHRFGWNN